MDSKWLKLGKAVLEMAGKAARSRRSSTSTTRRREDGAPRPGSGTGISMPSFPSPRLRDRRADAIRGRRAEDKVAARPDGPRGQARRGEVETADARPKISYSPAHDGDADPGEIVWAWVPFEDDPSQGKDRPLLVIGHIEDDVAALALTSKHHDDRHHHPIGRGEWDHRGRPSWIKLDRLLRLDPDGIRREGATIDENRFRNVVRAWEAY